MDKKLIQKYVEERAKVSIDYDIKTGRRHYTPEEYQQELAKEIKYYKSDIGNVVELENGQVLVIEKPRLETHFCFGYSDFGQGMTYDEANKCERCFNEDDFVNENIRRSGLQTRIKELNEMDSTQQVWAFQNNVTTNRFVSYQILHVTTEGIFYNYYFNYPKKFEDCPEYTVRLTNKDIEALKKALQDTLDEFNKRVHTYLKRFGLKKVHKWTYWVDE